MDNHQEVVKGRRRFKPRGGYLLLLYLPYPSRIRTRGKTFFLEDGYYVYVGSAMNSLFGRLSHHEKRDKRRFWHIDFLLDVSGLLLWVGIPSTNPIESSLTQTLRGKPVSGFGSSDSKDKSHLFYYKDFNSALSDIFRAVRSVVQ